MDISDSGWQRRNAGNDKAGEMMTSAELQEAITRALAEINQVKQQITQAANPCQSF